MAKIGVFDSGLGGLSVLDEALHQAPGHEYAYLADSANAPYGEKSTDWVTQRSHQLCTWLANQGCQAIVVACNTATAQAIAQIREQLRHIPIIGVEPGIKPAALTSSKKIVGVLATENTLKSDKFKALLATLPADCKFIQQAGIGLVPLIESGDLSSSSVEELLRKYLDPMVDQGADTLVLGCTHYPFLINKIRQMYPKDLNIVDTSEAVIRQMRRLVPDALSLESGRVHFYSTADGKKLLDQAQKLMHSDLKNHPLMSTTIQIDLA